MKVVIRGGCDTPFYLADVYLEAGEETLTDTMIWVEVERVAEERHKIYQPLDIVSFTRYVKNELGDWVTNYGTTPQGKTPSC